jgi:hypothetical protein
VRGECRELSLEEADTICGGAIGTGFCVQPTAQGGCNSQNISCSIGDAYCGEHQTAGLPCGSKAVYKNPTRCELNSQPGVATCCDDEAENQGQIVSVEVWFCRCLKCQNGGSWYCAKDSSWTDVYVKKCTIVTCPAE